VKFDHIGVTASELETGRALLETSIGIAGWTEAFRDDINDVWVQFGHCESGICYELVAPLSDRSPVRAVLSKRINVLNHVAYLVNDLPAQGARLVASGWAEVGPARPAIAYGGRPIQFFVSPTRLMLELIEAPDHAHAYVRPTRSSRIS
jgi:methylmalonyl-CoA/ethylmalonyl-CoA epimerase